MNKIFYTFYKQFDTSLLEFNTNLRAMSAFILESEYK